MLALIKMSNKNEGSGVIIAMTTPSTDSGTANSRNCANETGA
jgi:hypothetical protein